MVHKVYLFKNLDLSIDFITDIIDGTVFLVISNYVDLETLAILKDFHTIHRIYLLNANNQGEIYSKISGKIQVNSSSDISSLCAQIEDDMKILEREIFIFHVLPKQPLINHHDMNNVQNDTNLLSDQQEAIFMYSNVAKEILCLMEDDDLHKHTVDFCRSQYANNQHVLLLIDEFDRDYNRYSPITWYTRQTFLYKMLNRALRTNDVRTLFFLHNYIRHLHEQLVSLHQQHLPCEQLMLYRGQQMPTEDFEKIKDNTGGLLSISNFFSTTANIDVAEIFAGRPIHDQNTSCILFTINVDPKLHTFPFANIENYSFFNEAESEYLFSMGTIFRIQMVHQRDDGVWIVHLILTGDKDEKLAELKENLKSQISDENPTIMLGGLLIQMGEYEEAEFFYDIGLTMEKEPKRLGTIWNQLGIIASHLKNIAKSKECFERTLQIKRLYLAEDDPDLATVYNNIGTTHKEESNDALALEYFERALAICLKNPQTNRSKISTAYNNIAAIYIDQGKLDQAFSYQQRALEINLEYLPSNHPDLAHSYYVVALSLYGLGRYSEMLECMQKTLTIDEQSLPSNHPNKIFHEENLRATAKRIFERIMDGSIILEDDA